MSINQLETQLHAIQTTKATLNKQLKQTKDPHIQQKIEHQIHCLNQEETETLRKLNIRLEDITLTEPYEKPEDDKQWPI